MITFTFANGGVATMRTSGTEPKIKYYTELCAAPGNRFLQSSFQICLIFKLLLLLLIEYCFYVTVQYQFCNSNIFLNLFL